MTGETRVIVCLDDGVAAETMRRLPVELGIAEDPSPSLRWHGTRVATARLAGFDPAARSRLLDLPGVREVLVLPGGSRLSSAGSSRFPRGEVELRGGVRFGGDGLTIIAGPCSVESEDQILETADLVAGAGAQALRGGVFKPRSCAYSFGGLGERGLAYLAKARERSGLPVVTEALDSSLLDVVCQYADAIQIGARNMHNSRLLFHAGAHPSGLPVLLKRGFGATATELIEAAEYVLLGRLHAGHADGGLILCERGIRTFENATRFTLDVAVLPLVGQMSGLPIIGDPSHAAGARNLVRPIALAAVAAGAAGLIVEVHPRPRDAWCDASQSLDPVEFRTLAEQARRVRAAVAPPPMASRSRNNRPKQQRRTAG